MTKESNSCGDREDVCVYPCVRACVYARLCVCLAGLVWSPTHIVKSTRINVQLQTHTHTHAHIGRQAGRVSSRAGTEEGRGEQRRRVKGEEE